MNSKLVATGGITLLLTYRVLDSMNNLINFRFPLRIAAIRNGFHASIATALIFNVCSSFGENKVVDKRRELGIITKRFLITVKK